MCAYANKTGSQPMQLPVKFQYVTNINTNELQWAKNSYCISMSETLNKRTVNAEVLLFSDEAWELIIGISTLRETIGAVTKFTSFIYFFM